jgi:hypothetical protein
MRRMVITASLFLLLSLASSLPASAQRRSGGVAVSRGAVAAPAMRSYAVRSYAVHSYAPRTNVVRSEAPVRRWGSGVGFGFGYGSRPYHRRYSGYYPYAYSYPYYGYPYAYVDTYPYDDSGAYYADDDQSASQQQQLNAEIGSLNQQIEDLRDANDSLRDYVERGGSAAPYLAPQQAPERTVPQSLQQPMQSAVPAAPATVLVFRDGHQVEVHNYAIVGKTLWALSEKRSEKYPLTDLDLEKTQAENEKRGVEFTAPVE